MSMQREHHDSGSRGKRPRRRHSAFTARVALEALEGQKTLNELASEFGVHPVQITQWKRQLLDASPSIFETGSASSLDRYFQFYNYERLHQALGYQTPGLRSIVWPPNRQRAAPAPAEALERKRATSAMAQTWMPREQWDALVRGEGCPLCAEITTNAPVTDDGYTVADLALSRLRLSVHQSLPGYCVLICTKHVREPYELTPEEQRLFFTDLMRVGKALEQIFKAVKMNFELLGNAVPHLHCHIKPRSYGDPAPGRPIWPDQQPLFLSPQEYHERVALIREALA